MKRLYIVAFIAALIVSASAVSAEVTTTTYVGIEPAECADYGGREIAPLACVRYWLDVSDIPEGQWSEWIEVAFCESRFQYEVRGDQGRSHGLFQINIPVHQRRIESLGMTVEDMSTPLGNIAYAKVLYTDHNGWDEWSCRPRGSTAYTEAYHNARVHDGTDLNLFYIPDRYLSGHLIA